ncbi:ABC transporter permease [Reinekea thalattae]|uniref:ABC transporter permease subunit n=1 Tax=Reinekea thalattae TaxID=2593301 RepID=A0A5C8Z9J9_9GAMM|nr:ABC transporter permease subunit [Reinekea thalattae]TXR53923.1 ABC transporter permease subunit [Reinekea thalattae]
MINRLLQRPSANRFSSEFFAQAVFIVCLALFLFGPIINLLIWSVAEVWYFPHKLPAEWGFKYWRQVFSPYSDVTGSMISSVLIALATVVVCLVVSIPAGFALAQKSIPLRLFWMLLFLIPQAFPNLTVYINIAKIFYDFGLNGSFIGVVLVHSVHGLMFSVWICVAAFSGIDPLLSRASINLGASPLYTFFHIILPQAIPGIVVAGIFVFLESLDEFTGTFFVGTPEITTLPLLLYTASMEGNYQIASITALILLVPSVVFVLIIHRFVSAQMLSKIGQ